jgi:hypothetical protein
MAMITFSEGNPVNLLTVAGAVQSGLAQTNPPVDPVTTEAVLAALFLFLSTLPPAFLLQTLAQCMQDAQGGAILPSAPTGLPPAPGPGADCR